MSRDKREVVKSVQAYFSNMNQTASRILRDVKDVALNHNRRSDRNKSWSRLSEKQRAHEIWNTMAPGDIEEIYRIYPKQDSPDSDIEVFPVCKANGTKKVVTIEEDKVPFSWTDEHSAFSWESKRQLEMKIDSAPLATEEDFDAFDEEIEAHENELRAVLGIKASASSASVSSRNSSAGPRRATSPKVPPPSPPRPRIAPPAPPTLNAKSPSSPRMASPVNFEAPPGEVPRTNSPSTFKPKDPVKPCNRPNPKHPNAKPPPPPPVKVSTPPVPAPITTTTPKNLPVPKKVEIPKVPEPPAPPSCVPTDNENIPKTGFDFLDNW